MSDWILAGDLGGTKMVAALVDEKGKVAFRTSRPTRAAEGLHAVAGRFARLLRAVASRAGAGQIVACGVAAPGLVDSSAGQIRFAANLPGEPNFPLQQRLQAELGLPLVLENDLRLHALGESTFGAAHGCRNFLFVAAGTGIGSALFLDGRLYRGANAAAGEIGHVPLDFGPDAPPCGCGRRGCLEALASGPAIAARFRKLASEAGLPLAANDLSLKDIARWIERPDLQGELARRAIASGAQALGWGLSIAANLLDPERIFLGGGVARIGDFWLERVRQSLAGRTLNPAAAASLELARLGEDSALIGAAVLARRPSLGGSEPA